MIDTYFITACTYQKQAILQSERNANLLIETLFGYRDRSYFQVHEFVIMPDHVHALITPKESIERAMSILKGGFSFRMKRERRFVGEVWQQRYYDRRMREAAEYEAMKKYLLMNPVRRRLCASVNEFQFSSVGYRDRVDPRPQRLKPQDF